MTEYGYIKMDVRTAAASDSDTCSRIVLPARGKSDEISPGKDCFFMSACTAAFYACRRFPPCRAADSYKYPAAFIPGAVFFPVPAHSKPGHAALPCHLDCGIFL